MSKRFSVLVVFTFSLFFALNGRPAFAIEPHSGDAAAPAPESADVEAGPIKRRIDDGTDVKRRIKDLDAKSEEQKNELKRLREGMLAKPDPADALFAKFSDAHKKLTEKLEQLDLDLISLAGMRNSPNKVVTTGLMAELLKMRHEGVKLHRLEVGALDRKSEENIKFMNKRLTEMKAVDQTATYAADLVKYASLQGKDGKPLFTDKEVIRKAATKFANPDSGGKKEDPTAPLPPETETRASAANFINGFFKKVGAQLMTNNPDEVTAYEKRDLAIQAKIKEYKKQLEAKKAAAGQ